MTAAPPTILFFNINGNGLGHLSRCLAYARRIEDRARCVFFSNASAIEIIHEMGFEADYLVSPFWSRANGRDWNRQLAPRLGLLLEHIRPAALVFDGSWPFQGLLDTVDAYAAHYARPKLIWSRRGSLKRGTIKVPVPEHRFDLVIEPGEIGAERSVAKREPDEIGAERSEAKREPPGRKLVVPPVTLLEDDELLDRAEARAALGLERNTRYALFSLGPGNLKDVSEIGKELIAALQAQGFTAVWARAPISERDVALPDHVVPITAYPLVRYMKGFDLFVSAAGYNSCCEALQSRVPSLFVPNRDVIDDQTRRARLIAEHMAAVISPCETAEQRSNAVARLVGLAGEGPEKGSSLDLGGARLAADEILASALTLIND